VLSWVELDAFSRQYSVNVLAQLFVLPESIHQRWEMVLVLTTKSVNRGVYIGRRCVWFKIGAKQLSEIGLTIRPVVDTFR
jgi:hypothetical protein